MLEMTEITYWHWLILGTVLMILEVLSFTAILMWAGAGALFTALLVFLLPGTSWQMQVLSFSVSTVFLLAITRFWILRRDITSEQPTLNRRGESLIGQTHALKDAITSGQGHINVHDTIWQLRGPDLPAGTLIKIIAIENNTLRVEIAD